MQLSVYEWRSIPNLPTAGFDKFRNNKPWCRLSSVVPGCVCVVCHVCKFCCIRQEVVTGSAVALHCCKAHSKINRKMGNLTRCKIVTPKNFNLKLCTRDYVGEATHHANFGSRYTGDFCPYRRNITTLWLFLTVLSCPVLSFFFSGTRPGRTAEPIFTVYGSNDVFSHKEVPLGVRMMGNVIWGKYTPKTTQKWAWIGNFKPKRQNIKTRCSAQRDRAAGCVIVFAKSRTLERGDNDLRIL